MNASTASGSTTPSTSPARPTPTGPGSTPSDPTRRRPGTGPGHPPRPGRPGHPQLSPPRNPANHSTQDNATTGQPELDVHHCPKNLLHSGVCRRTVEGLVPGRGTARLPAHPTAWGRSPSRPRGRAVAKLNRTLTKRRDDILALSDHRDSSNDPTGIINGRFEHLRDHLVFRNPTQLHHPITTRDQRVYTQPTHEIAKSRISECQL